VLLRRIDEGNKWHMPPSQRLQEWHRQYAANKEN
jgi:polar amino acid transport system substrate-binding protein